MTQAASHLSLLYPGQLTPSRRKHRALHTLCSRATLSLCTTNRDQLLFELFKAESDSPGVLPVAAATQAFDCAESGNANIGWWLRADPVVLRADGDRLLMLGNHTLALSSAETTALGAELHPLFAAYGMAFFAPHPTRWYLRLESDPNLTLTALEDAVAHDILQHLPQSSEAQTAARWRRLLNEVQMQLHNSPVNQARLARGELPVNSVWFWGGGTVPTPAPRHFQQVWSDDPVCLGLACLSNTPHATPPDGTDWLQHIVQPGHRLLVLPSPTTPAADEYAALFSRQWCAPLVAAAQSGALDLLDIYTKDGNVFHATPQTLRRWYDRFL